MTLLDVQDLHAGYGGKEILSGVSFLAKSGTMTGILGVNGCGKSTLMKAMCGILPCSGKIMLCGKDIHILSNREMARISRYIPQRTGISLDISVLDVVLMGFNPQLGLLQNPGSAMRVAAMTALQSVGLETKAGDNFQSLSEGQKQLCLLSRAMLLSSGVLFLDEPESALDFSGRYKMLGMIRSWLERTESAAVVTLHDPQLAINCCDTLLLLQDGKVLSAIQPAKDPLPEMEAMLRKVYGNLSIHSCVTRTGKMQLVLLKEE